MTVKMRHRNTRPIVKLAMDGKTVIKEYNSMAEAAEELGVTSSRLSLAANGFANSCMGYKWRFKEEHEKIEKKSSEN